MVDGHRAPLKKGIDSSETRRRREDFRVKLRKDKREEGLSKRRALAAGANEPQVTDSALVVAGNGATNNEEFANSTATKRIYDVSDIPEITAIIKDGTMDDNRILEAIRGFRRLLSTERNPPVEEVLNSGILPYFVHYLGKHDNEMIQFEAAWALTNIASTDFTAEVVKAGAIQPLTNLLRSPSPDVREQSAWCIGNVAGDCVSFRDEVLGCGALTPLLQNIAQPASESLLNNATWSLSNLCRGKPQPDIRVVGAAIPLLCHLLSQGSKDAMVDAAWALSYLSDGDDEKIQAVLESGVTPNLVNLLTSEHANMITPSLRTLGNFVSGNDVQTQAVIDAGVLEKVESLLKHGRKLIRKETCWLLSNIAAGTVKQIDSLLNLPDVLEIVIDMIERDVWEVRKEATWVISNIATGGNDTQVQKLVDVNGIGALCSMLDCPEPKIVLVALDAVDKILKTGQKIGKNYLALVDESDGIDKLENLQSHASEEIYAKAVAIIEEYFGAEDIDDENLAPTTDGQTFSFGIAKEVSTSPNQFSNFDFSFSSPTMDM